jgi:two-component system, OmpR family, sensor histidine kinase MprB
MTEGNALTGGHRSAPQLDAERSDALSQTEELIQHAGRPVRRIGGSQPVTAAVAPRGLRLSLRTRIGWLVGLTVGAAVAFTSLAAYLTVRQGLYHALDNNLQRRAQKAVSTAVGRPAGFEHVTAAALGVASDVRIGLLDLETNKIYIADGATVPPVEGPEIEVAQGLTSTSLRSAVLDGVKYRVAAVRAGPGAALVLAQSTAETHDELGQLGLVLLLVGAVGIAASVSSGVAVARAALAPVARLTAATERVAETDRLDPIPVSGDDELARLTASFNGMLAALAGSRARQQQLVADAGHELRTPLTSLRTNLDLLAQSLRPGGPSLEPADRDALLADVRAQAAELSGLVGALVELAREDPPAVTAVPVELADTVARAVDRVRRRAPGLRFDVQTEPWEVNGDPTALDRAVTNLLDNAAKWSPPDGLVSVRLAGGELTVTDQGPGVAETDRPYVFERFYRSAEARTTPGSGLGLAIVRQAADRHGGTVTVDAAPGGGALFRLRLPGHPD